MPTTTIEDPLSQKVAPPPTSVGPRPGVDHILVGTDGSTHDNVCVAYALSFARALGKRVTIVHVVEHGQSGDRPHSTDALACELSYQEARARLEHLKLCAESTSGQQVETRLEEGRAAERIVALVSELHVDLVVLGSGEATGHSSWNVGRIAAQVLAAGQCSVLITRGESQGLSMAPLRKIVVPLDGSLRTESVLPIAELIANSHAGIVLVHVVAEPVPSEVLVSPADLDLARRLAARLARRAEKYLSTLARHVSHQGCFVQTLVERQVDKRQYLAEISAQDDVGLLVLSAHGSTCNAHEPFGSVTAHLLSHSHASVLVLQDLPATPVVSRHDAREHVPSRMLRTGAPEQA